MARKAAEVGVAKAGLDVISTFALAVLAGAFIALGAAFATTVLAGSSALPYGVARLLGGLAFSLGLILIVIAWASRRVAETRMLTLWVVVYLGNAVGALATAGLIFAGRQFTFGKGAVGDTALSIAVTETGLGRGQAVALGILCNALVCLAVWLTYGARSLMDRVIAVVPPITAFVALGFEHSIANMYFIPYALLVKGDTGWPAGRSGLPDLGRLGWGRFLWANLLPVTIGNIVGGAVLVGAVYWFAYLRPRADA